MAKGFPGPAGRARAGHALRLQLGATYMLSAIVQGLMGRGSSRFWDLRLFESLGVGAPTWETSP